MAKLLDLGHEDSTPYRELALFLGRLGNSATHYCGSKPDLCRKVHVEFSRTDLVRRLETADKTSTESDAPLRPESISFPLPEQLSIVSTRTRRVAELMGLIEINRLIREVDTSLEAVARRIAFLSGTTRMPGMTVVPQRLDALVQKWA